MIHLGKLKLQILIRIYVYAKKIDFMHLNYYFIIRKFMLKEVYYEKENYCFPRS